MDNLFLILFLFSGLALILGLIKPSLVKQESRGKVFKRCGAAIVIFFILFGITVPDISVADQVKNAREYIKEEKYSLSVTSYEGALNSWSNEKNYSFTKDKIKSELTKAKQAYSKRLTTDAKTAIENNNIDTAEDKLNDVKKYSPNNKEINQLQSQIKEIKITNKINKYLDQALSEADIENYEKAAEKINKARQLGYIERIDKVKNKLSSNIETVVEDYLSKASSSLEEWEIKKAKRYIESVKNLSPNHKELKDLETKMNEKQEIISQIGEKPKNSSWDASVRPVKRFLESNLKDPDSVEYIEWSPVHLTRVEGQPLWRVRAKYRAKNSFGGYVIEEKLFYMANGQVITYKNFGY
jgi:tetratricopeptide (TPR) repeat protein